MERKGAVNWDICQVASILANKRPGPAYHADCKMSKDIWEVVAQYYKDPCVYDDVPAKDWKRCEDYISPELLNAFLDIPGMVLAGGAAVPGITRNQMGDIDFFYQGTTISSRDMKDGLTYSNMSEGTDTKEFKKLRELLVKYRFTCRRLHDEKNYYISIEKDPNFKNYSVDVTKYGYSTINVIVLIGPPGLPCITQFFMDYQQVMFEKVKDNRVRRARTKLAREAHLTREAKAYSLVPCSYRKLLHEENKIIRKNFRIPGENRCPVSIFYMPIKIYTDFSKLLGGPPECGFEMSSKMGSHIRPDFMSPAELEIRPLFKSSDVNEIRKREKECSGFLCVNYSNDSSSRTLVGTILFYVLTGVYNHGFEPQEEHRSDIRLF